MKKYIFKYLFSVVLAILIILSGFPPIEAVNAQQTDLQSVINKMRNAVRTISYEAEITTSMSGPKGIRTIKKKVVSNPPREYKEDLILTPEQEERFKKFNEKNRSGTPHRGGRRPDNPDRFRSYSHSSNYFSWMWINAERLTGSYDVEFNENEKYTDYDVYYIAILPKYELRHGYKLWIDKESGLVLKKETLLSHNGDSLSITEEVTSFTVTGVRERSERRERGQGNPRRRGGGGGRRSMETKQYKTVDELPDKLKTSIVLPKNLPEGFVLTNIRVTHEREHSTFHQIYSDGIIMFSIFQMDGKMPRQFQEMAKDNHRPRSMSEQTVIYKQEDKRNFIVIGYAHKKLLQPVLDSLK